MSKELEILRLLSGTEEEFAHGLVALGWYDYPPTLADYSFNGKARLSLNPQFRRAGLTVRGSGAWVYRLNLSSGKWQDAVAIVESQLKAEPQFAVVFCNLPNALLVMAPASPEKAFAKSSSGIAIDAIHLYRDNRQSNFEPEMIRRLCKAAKEQFRKRLQEIIKTEQVTTAFYNDFKKQLDAFKSDIGGIDIPGDKTWYSSVMLNRLMFIYFLQRKGFLDGDERYLNNRLRMVQERRGADKFQSFYRCFLLRLFHEGLGAQIRSSDFEDYFGKVPYLNGGLFEVHQIEDKYKGVIDIPDKAFERVFQFFDGYEWCLDTRPARSKNEINPDVLGYIFEKYINQKQMGAYYTKEDITEYISANTIISFLFDAVKKKHSSAFQGDNSVWKILQSDPDRYINEAIRKGVDLPLPDFIEFGLHDISRRDQWNELVPDEYGLPTEIWREVVLRRKQYAVIKAKLTNGEIQSIGDMIAYNLDIRQFATDVIDLTDDSELIKAFWDTMAGRLPEKSNEKGTQPISILDPTCGSGAFLFAALNILQQLYESCLDRMCEHTDRASTQTNYREFQRVIDRMNDRNRHPSRDYFILKTIILSNLFGVDVMEEAVEICKLRLFLKLAAQVTPDSSKSNYGLEPLPDIDFNIRSGNTLIGYATKDEVKVATATASGQISLDLAGADEAFRRIDEAACIADRAFQKFHEMQVLEGMRHEDFSQAKGELKKRLGDLTSELNRYLAKQYSVDVTSETAYQQWFSKHQPFHWFVEFYGIMERGGFDIVIGNPPYVDYAKVRNQYNIQEHLFTTLPCGNLYAYVVERSRNLLRQDGYLGFILPLSSSNANGNSSLQRLLRTFPRLYVSHFAVRPSKLFVGVDMNLTIVFGGGAATGHTSNTSSFIRWSSEFRPYLFDSIRYASHDIVIKDAAFPKFGDNIEASIWKKLFSGYKPINSFLDLNPSTKLCFHSFGRYWRKCILEKLSDNYQEFNVASSIAPYVICLLNSQLAYWYWIASSDCYRFTKTDALNLPVAHEADSSTFSQLSEALLDSYERHAVKQEKRARNGELVVEKQFFPVKSKTILDEIDRRLGECFGFTKDEIEYIINYDIKHRQTSNGDD